MTVNSPSQPMQAKLTPVESSTERLPYWARSTNPIVRRHLGLYWRTIPPDVQPFLMILGIWLGLMGIGILFPFILDFAMISFLASLMVLPFAGVYYGYTLLSIASEAATSMQAEMDNNTFELLRTTPMNLSQILLGKVAASLWKHMDDLIMLSQLALAFSPPAIFAEYAAIWPAEQSVFLAPVLTLVASVVVLLRVFLEPLMVGVLAVFIGVVVPGRSRAITTSVFIGAFYFLLLNIFARSPNVRGYQVPRGTSVPPNVPLLLLVDLVLPIVLPLLISYGLLKLSEYILTRD
ncbi:MAG: hypothetical protein KC496_11990 [Anaerolineae bacterium]|nr:hypothetical protein [Anaerolineae bacterium]